MFKHTLLVFTLASSWSQVALAVEGVADDLPEGASKKEPVGEIAKGGAAVIVASRPAARSSLIRFDPPKRERPTTFGTACAELARKGLKGDELEKQLKGDELEKQLKNLDACGLGKERGGQAASAGVAAIQGLGDFLVARAKDELVLYGVEQVGLNLCSDAKVAVLFKESCAEVRGPECKDEKEADRAACSIDPEAITSGRFQAAFRADIRELPRSIVDSSTVETTHKAYLRALSRAAADVMLGASPDHFAAIAARYLKEEALAEQPSTLPCDVNSLTPTCAAGLVLTAAASARDLVVSSPDSSQDGRINFGEWLNRTAVSYCRDFAGAADGKHQCITGSAIYANLLDVSEAWLASYAGVLQALHSFEQLSQAGKPTPEEVVAFAEHLSVAIEATAVASFKVAGCLKAGRACAPAAVQVPKEWKDAVSVTRLTGSLAAAVMARDVPASLRAVRSLVEFTKFENKDRVLRAVDFAVALSLSKSREDSKAVIEALADPISSYRAKYGMQSGMRITLNGFVGVIGSFQRTLNTDVNEKRAAFRFGAPVGIDITPSALSWDSFNIGFGAVALDPLALASVDTEGDSPDADWRTALTPGGYLRLGLFHSPINLMAIGTYQPFNERQEDCTDDCWRGAWQVGGALAVDIPIITFK
jgi:hypothetical protein